MEKKIVFTGSAAAIITPFRDDLFVNYEELGRIVEFQIENGTDAIVVCGTTGEASTMPDEEHLRVVKYVVDKVNKRVPVIAGVGSNHTSHGVKLSLAAEAYGADALLHVTPYYNKTSQKGLVRHFEAMANAVKVPIILYNVPSRTGMTIQPQTYRELSYIENIVATKEASGNFSAIATAMDLCGENLHFYSGNDDQIVPLMALGGKGVISVLANVRPKECKQLCDYALAGDFKNAAQLQLMLMPLINGLFCDVNPIPVKAAMNLMGFAAGECRPPLCGLDADKCALLQELLA
ncbi:MAG: 4-hydroxy-tetrahydrodipicolinate synthase [Oscillospiraceae bacterium]|nr:4-hydroxy-tetrahydrodipicolinate synthase [Oscillospiraceae bacterium]